MVRLFDLARSSDAGRIEDPYTLELYDEGLRSCNAQPIGREVQALCQLRHDAVKVNPKNQELASQSFRACLGWKAYDHAFLVSRGTLVSTV